jgi:hypothetical protein
LRVRRLSTTAVTLTGRPRRGSRRQRGYELVVHELGWGGKIHLDTGAVEAMLWRQLRTPVRLAHASAGAGERPAAAGHELTALWRYRDVWYLASEDATASTIVEAAESPQPIDRERPVREHTESWLGPPELWPDPPKQRERILQREESFTFHVGRLVRKRVLSELVEYARQEQLEISYEVNPHVFTVELMVTVRGNSRAVSGFEGLVASLLFRYQIG